MTRPLDTWVVVGVVSGVVSGIVRARGVEGRGTRLSDWWGGRGWRRVCRGGTRRHLLSACTSADCLADYLLDRAVGKLPETSRARFAEERQDHRQHYSGWRLVWWALCVRATALRTVTALGEGADLLACVSDGDSTAWEELFCRYNGLVRSTVASFRLQEADAQEAVQNTWLRVMERMDTIRDPQRLGAGWRRRPAGSAWR